MAYGKRTPLSEYRLQGRYGSGIRTLARNNKSGSIIDARVVKPADQITLITTGGQALRTKVKNISRQGRSTQGVQIMSLASGDSLASIALLTDDQRRGVDDDQPPVTDEDRDIAPAR